MPLVNAKCTNCGANLTVDSTKDAAVCEYCGSAYIVEKAIQNYNITNNIHADVVNIYGGNSADFVIRAGTLEKYTGAATDVIIPNSVTKIGDHAFSRCTGLTSVTIPNSVTEIGSDAFFGCTELTSVTIPDSVTVIGENAFLGCMRLTSVTIPNSVTVIGDWAFEHCTGLKSITISNGVKSIGKWAFEGCTGLTSVTIPNSVTEIGDDAFHGCTGLTSVTIPNGVTVIGHSAFEGCTGLTSVTIPNSVTEIGWEAFKGCTGLTSVVIPDSVMVIGLEAFKNTGLTHVTVPKDIVTENRFPNKCRITKRGGCYIATAVYGSYDCPQVWTLRRFRDNKLAQTRHGRLFIKIYYALSPTAVKLFGKTTWFQNFWRGRLDKFVRKLQQEGVESTPYQDSCILKKSKPDK